MTLQDVINEVYRKRVNLINKQESSLLAVRSIQTDDAALRFALNEAVLDSYAPLFKQCRIEIDILEAAQKRIEQ